MKLDLTTLEIREMFHAGGHTLPICVCRLTFNNEMDQESSAKKYETDGWKVVGAGTTKQGEYFFDAAKKLGVAQ